MKAEMRCLVPCVHCKLRRAVGVEPYMFTLKECVDAAASGHPFVYCHNIRSPARCVRLDQLALDVAMADLRIIAPSELQLGRELGHGAFGTVYEGQWKSERVAVKRLITSEADEERVDKFNEFQREVWVMSNLNHPCLTHLFGVTIHPLQMVMQFCSFGDLFNFLRPKKSVPRGAPPSDERGVIAARDFPWQLRYAMAVDIARGMQYLQSITPPIIHRDLRSPNIFLVSLSTSAPVRAQVADFGLSRTVADKISGMLGSWQWMAPEVIDSNNNLFDETADTYSFGIVIWEIFTGGLLPFEEYITEERFCNPMQGPDGKPVMALRVPNIKQAIIQEDLRPTIPKEWPQALANIIRACWSKEPHKRPTFDRILKVLCECGNIPLPLAAGDTGSFNARHYAITHPAADDADEELDVIAVDSGRTASVTAGPRPSFRSLASLAASVAIEERAFCSAMVGDSLWVGGSAGTIYVFSADMLVLRHKWPAHQQRLYSLVHTETGVWSGSEDGWLKIWNPDDFQLVREIRHSSKQMFIKCMILVTSSTGKQTVWVGLPVAGEIRVWDVHVRSLTLSQIALSNCSLTHADLDTYRPMSCCVRSNSNAHPRARPRSFRWRKWATKCGSVLDATFTPTTLIPTFKRAPSRPTMATCMSS